MSNVTHAEPFTEMVHARFLTWMEIADNRSQPIRTEGVAGPLAGLDEMEHAHDGMHSIMSMLADEQNCRINDGIAMKLFNIRLEKKLLIFLTTLCCDTENERLSFLVYLSLLRLMIVEDKTIPIDIPSDAARLIFTPETVTAIKNDKNSSVHIGFRRVSTEEFISRFDNRMFTVQQLDEMVDLQRLDHTDPLHSMTSTGNLIELAWMLCIHHLKRARITALQELQRAA